MISACDRLVLVVGPSAVSSDYVTHEWRFAFHKAVICVNPIVRLNGADAAGKRIDAYDLLPEDLRGPHAEDFRDDSAFDFHLANIVRQLSEAMTPLGKLVAVPTLPDHYLEQGERIRALRDMVLADLKKPVVVSGAIMAASAQREVRKLYWDRETEEIDYQPLGFDGGH